MKAASTTIRIPVALHEELREFAEEGGSTLTGVLVEALELYRRERFVARVNAGYSLLREDAADWKAHRSRARRVGLDAGGRPAQDRTETPEPQEVNPVFPRRGELWFADLNPTRGARAAGYEAGARPLGRQLQRRPGRTRHRAPGHINASADSLARRGPGTGGRPDDSVGGPCRPGEDDRARAPRPSIGCRLASDA